jgi:two-component system, sensor histidine kinase LadS
MRCIAGQSWAACWGALVLALFMSGCAGAALAQARPALPTLLLGDSQPPVDAQDLALVWIDPNGTAGLEQVMQSAAAFQPPRAGAIYSLGERAALWLHYRLLRGRDEHHRWLMVFPMPTLDSATVYQQEGKGGRWVAQAAGDTMAVSGWPEPGRYPHFRLELPPGQTTDVYVRIRHFTPANFPVRLISETAFDQRIQLEYLGLGLTFGALLLLIATCLAQSLVYRDGVYAWYAVYALVTAIGVAAYTGVAAHLLWPGFGALGDSPQGSLALLAAGAAMLFVRNLTGISARHRLIDRMIYASGLAGIALALVFPMLPKPPGLTMLAVYVAAATLANMWIAFAAWRRGDVVGAWVLLAYLPLSLAVGMALARLFGWLPISFGTQYAIVVAMALEVPLLLVALNIRSRQRHGVQIREQALSSQDALTGLLAPHLFHDRLQQVATRYKRYQQNCAVVFIDLVNHSRIKAHYGTAVAEQSLLRCVIKLRRLLRDVDTVSRVGEARFGLILEGVSSRASVTDRAARLIAAGLMPLQGLKPDVTLQFHIAAVLLGERVDEPSALEDALGALLSGMSSRTRRPIRFLEPEATGEGALEADSSLLDSDSVPPPPPPQPAAAAPAPAPPPMAGDLSRSATGP